MSDNPYLRRLSKQGIGASGRASEARLAKSLGGKARPASGAMQGAKGDIDLGPILMEAKSTVQQSMSLKREWLLKIANEAQDAGKTPALAISFVRENGRPLPNGEWVAIPLSVWQEIMS